MRPLLANASKQRTTIIAVRITVRISRPGDMKMPGLDRQHFYRSLARNGNALNGSYS